MASWLLQIASKNLLNGDNKSVILNVIRYSSKIKPKQPKPGTIKHRNLIQSCCQSLAARGFLRSYKSYTPDENAAEKVTAICAEVLGNKYDSDAPLSREDKFFILNTCFKEFNHSVPNSTLHKMVTPNDIIEFYQTPVSVTNPFDQLKERDLPPNLHIQYDYIRFNPQTDTRFKGISAFPRSSTIVTGLKSREKYSGYKNKSPYLDTEAITQEDYKKML